MRLRTRAGALIAALVVSVMSVGTRPASQTTPGQTGSLPARFSDTEFWQLVERFSEPDGYFDSDNLISNEDGFQAVVPQLTSTVRPGGVYLGVGPDQNFTYILAARAKAAFITDVRRGNLHVHLLYKALFELSPDRADFLAHLFGRRRPAGLGVTSTAAELLTAYRSIAPDRTFQNQTARAVADRLTGGARFPLRPDDMPAIAAIHAEFVAAGPDLRFVSSRGGNWYPTFMDLQVATDRRGLAHGYLATETQYTRVRDLERANLIVPVVGNFGGARALREIGRYLKTNGETVSVFYTSNVERYLFRDGLWDDFVANMTSLPIDASSTLVRSCFDSCSSAGDSRAVTLLDSIERSARRREDWTGSDVTGTCCHARGGDVFGGRMRVRAAFASTVVMALLVWAAPQPLASQRTASSLPAALSDREFWSLVEEFSEPEGFFQSETLVGNERPLQHVVPALETMRRGDGYLGVAPDQNFTYIVALQPSIAFIVDIRRGNLLLHLMYKALFELSDDRADFLSRLFARPRPAGLDAQTSVDDLLDAYWEVEADAELERDHASRDQRAVDHDARIPSDVGRSLEDRRHLRDVRATRARAELFAGECARDADLRGDADGNGPGRPAARVSGDRGQLPSRQGPRSAESRRAHRRRLRRPESAAIGWRLPSTTRRRGAGVLYVQRRAVSVPQ